MNGITNSIADSDTHTFRWGDYEIRVSLIDGKPWFAAADVCKALEIKNSRDALSRLDEDEKGVGLIYTLGGEQKMNIVNEYGLYTLILSSRKPEAKEFKRWITHEVLPAINRHGMYMTEGVENLMFTDPRKFAELALRFADERDKRREAERQLALQAPKVEKHDQLMSADGGILCGDMSKMLERNGHKWLKFPDGTRKKMGQNNFMLWLRVMNYICSAHGERYNTPKQKWVERGYFILKENAVDMGGSNRVTLTTLITPAGQSYFLDLFQKGETTNA